MADEMKITSSLEDYLEAIFVLSIKKDSVRVTDIASFLDVTKPSVNHAVGALKSMAYLEHESYGEITLTPSGESYAANILRRHKMIKRFLEKTLGVSETLAEQDACRMEHVMSAETVEKLYSYLEKNLT